MVLPTCALQDPTKDLLRIYSLPEDAFEVVPQAYADEAVAETGAQEPAPVAGGAAAPGDEE